MTIVPIFFGYVFSQIRPITSQKTHTEKDWQLVKKLIDLWFVITKYLQYWPSMRYWYYWRAPTHRMTWFCSMLPNLKGGPHLDRVPVSVSEWLLGSFVLILYLSNSTNFHKYWVGNAVYPHPPSTIPTLKYINIVVTMLCKYCTYFVHILHIYCTDIVHILHIEYCLWARTQINLLSTQ